MKVAIYCRVSTDKQELNTQLEICKKHCEIKGYEIYKVYQDIISGTTTSREAFNEMLNDMRAYKFQGIVFTKLDRLARSLSHLLSLFEEFKNKGVEIISVSQNIDTTTSTGKLQMQILGAFSEFERNLISERTKEGLEHSPNKARIGKRGKDLKPRLKRGRLRNPLFMSNQS